VRQAKIQDRLDYSTQSLVPYCLLRPCNAEVYKDTHLWSMDKANEGKEKSSCLSDVICKS
jgi:hypothetical protein